MSLGIWSHNGTVIVEQLLEAILQWIDNDDDNDELFFRNIYTPTHREQDLNLRRAWIQTLTNDAVQQW